jgi:hypothetical protein
VQFKEVEENKIVYLEGNKCQIMESYPSLWLSDIQQKVGINKDVEVSAISSNDMMMIGFKNNQS